MFGMSLPQIPKPPEPTPIQKIVKAAFGRDLTVGEMINILVLSGKDFDSIRRMPYPEFLQSVVELAEKT